MEGLRAALILFLMVTSSTCKPNWHMCAIMGSHESESSESSEEVAPVPNTTPPPVPLTTVAPDTEGPKVDPHTDVGLTVPPEPTLVLLIEESTRPAGTPDPPGSIGPGPEMPDTPPAPTITEHLLTAKPESRGDV